jgi:ABC-type multidrug transport system fused ATPase/permease subunit
MVANFFFYGSIASILLVGGILVEKDKLKLGDIASFMFYMIQILIEFMMLA